MSRRPALKVGDVVRLSKAGKKAYGRLYHMNSRSMIVVSFIGDSSEGNTIVACNLPETDGLRGRKCHLKRKHLWLTGYNVNNGNTVVKKTTATGKSFIPQAKKTSGQCSCSIESLMTFGCKCGGV